jgi:PIN domain nuclease of toxin-antitoxin system
LARAAIEDDGNFIGAASTWEILTKPPKRAFCAI